MSTYWDLYCVTCDATAGAFHWNHGAGQLRDLIPKLPAIAALGHFADEVRFYGAETQSYDALVEFATKHAGHDIRPRNEYGQTDDQCREYWTCGTCQTRHNCERPIDHEGDHGRRWTTTESKVAVVAATSYPIIICDRCGDNIGSVERDIDGNTTHKCRGLDPGKEP